MCHVYGTGENTWTRLCYRTGQPGARIPGDARGPNGHVPASRRKKHAGPTPKRPASTRTGLRAVRRPATGA